MKSPYTNLEELIGNGIITHQKLVLESLDDRIALKNYSRKLQTLLHIKEQLGKTPIPVLVDDGHYIETQIYPSDELSLTLCYIRGNATRVMFEIGKMDSPEYHIIFDGYKVYRAAEKDIDTITVGYDNIHDMMKMLTVLMTGLAL